MLFWDNLNNFGKTAYVGSKTSLLALSGVGAYTLLKCFTSNPYVLLGATFLGMMSADIADEKVKFSEAVACGAHFMTTPLNTL